MAAITGDRRAVSSSIAIALMVVVFVLVAGFVGMVVFISGDDTGGVDAGVSVEQAEGQTTVTWTEEGSAERISFSGAASGPTLVTTGDSYTFEGLEAGTTLTIIAEGPNGEETIIRSVEITADGAGG